MNFEECLNSESYKDEERCERERMYIDKMSSIDLTIIFPKKLMSRMQGRSLSIKVDSVINQTEAAISISFLGV